MLSALIAQDAQNISKTGIFFLIVTTLNPKSLIAFIASFMTVESWLWIAARLLLSSTLYSANPLILDKDLSIVRAEISFSKFSNGRYTNCFSFVFIIELLNHL